MNLIVIDFRFWYTCIAKYLDEEAILLRDLK